MSEGGRSKWPDRRVVTWFTATAMMCVISSAIGFVWLPSIQPTARDLSLWSIICHAIGVPDGNAGKAGILTGQVPSTLAWTPATREFLTGGDAVRGAGLATTCNNCHGATGISSDAAIPNLAGQTVPAIYKQLDDFRSGKRDAAVMGVYLRRLSRQDLLDLAAHFASLPNSLDQATRVQSRNDAIAEQLVKNGNPMRGIASCAACHGPQGLVTGAPGLGGQQRPYVVQQLQAFRAGTRHNDIDEQMRSVVRQMTDNEIVALSAYYSRFAQ